MGPLASTFTMSDRQLQWLLRQHRGSVCPPDTRAESGARPGRRSGAGARRCSHVHYGTEAAHVLQTGRARMQSVTTTSCRTTSCSSRARRSSSTGRMPASFHCQTRENWLETTGCAAPSQEQLLRLRRASAGHLLSSFDMRCPSTCTRARTQHADSQGASGTQCSVPVTVTVTVSCTQCSRLGTDCARRCLQEPHWPAKAILAAAVTPAVRHAR